MSSSGSHARSVIPPFVSSKNPTPIPVADEIRHDALRQFALDPAVSALEFVESVDVAGSIVRVDALVVTGVRRNLIEFEHASVLRDLDDEGLHLLALQKLQATPLFLSTSFIRRKPVAANAREIWSHHAHRVGLDRRLAICSALDLNGPMHMASLAREFGRDAKLDVYALACEAALTIDLGTRLGSSMVSIARPARRLSTSIVRDRAVTR